MLYQVMQVKPRSGEKFRNDYGKRCWSTVRAIYAIRRCCSWLISNVVLMRLGKRERSARRVDALEEHATMARVARVDAQGLASIPSSWRLWPTGKASRAWGWDWRAKRRIERNA